MNTALQSPETIPLNNGSLRCTPDEAPATMTVQELSSPWAVFQPGVYHRMGSWITTRARAFVAMLGLM